MKHKAQEALDTLYDEASCECEIDEDTGELLIFDCTSHDKYLNLREPLQQLIDNALTVDLISLNIEIICERMYKFRNLKKRRKDDSFDAFISKCQKILTFLDKQKEMWEEE